MSSLLVRRYIPQAIVLIFALIVSVDYFVSIGLTPYVTKMTAYATLMVNFTFIMGAGLYTISMLRRMLRSSRLRTEPKRAFNMFTVSSQFILFFATLLIGLLQGTLSPAYTYLYMAFSLVPTMVLTAVRFVQESGAAYRVMRVKNLDAALLLISGAIYFFGNTSGSQALLGTWPMSLATWFNTVPSMSANRALAIGAGLGTIATGIRTLAGRERASREAM